MAGARACPAVRRLHHRAARRARLHRAPRRAV